MNTVKAQFRSLQKFSTIECAKQHLTICSNYNENMSSSDEGKRNYTIFRKNDKYNEQNDWEQRPFPLRVLQPKEIKHSHQ